MQAADAAVSGGSRSSLLRERGTGGGSPWLVEKLKKLKELSEMVAGPKWKNFVRRIGKFCSPKKHVNSTQQNAQFQYSPESYALNFSGGDNSEDHALLHCLILRLFCHWN
ncbi:hypothetical protein MIMGU_mgv1a024779mg [Erythranthe guttata]|uniref:Uncharacterized protein n=1 Tax=Erythranthe guttata TaxID=4155 RepID=A0A022Q7P7_ERYGU|nr:hypothetical protein MIMGU_mgv1a024779mg [Erythranthe guttata]